VETGSAVLSLHLGVPSNITDETRRVV
jgi:hypothetical protein